MIDKKSISEALDKKLKELSQKLQREEAKKMVEKK